MRTMLTPWISNPTPTPTPTSAPAAPGCNGFAECATQKAETVAKTAWELTKVLPNPLGGTARGIDTTVKVADFANDPAGYTASQTQSAAASFTGDVIGSVISYTSPDLSVTWFKDVYQLNFGIGVIIAACLLLWSFLRAAQGKISGTQLLETLTQRLPLFWIGAMFGPALATFAIALSGALSRMFVERFLGVGVNQIVTNLVQSFLSINIAQISGGAIVATVIFALLIVALLIILVILIGAGLALILSAAVFPIGWAWTINPATKKTGRRVIMVWVALLFTPSIVLLMIGIGIRLTSGTSFNILNEGMRALINVITVAIVIVMAGLSPWAMAKFAPIMPWMSGTEGVSIDAPGSSAGGRDTGGEPGGSATSRLAARQSSEGSGNSGRPGGFLGGGKSAGSALAALAGGAAGSGGAAGAAEGATKGAQAGAALGPGAAAAGAAAGGAGGALGEGIAKAGSAAGSATGEAAAAGTAAQPNGSSTPSAGAAGSGGAAGAAEGATKGAQAGAALGPGAAAAGAAAGGAGGALGEGIAKAGSAAESAAGSATGEAAAAGTAAQPNGSSTPSAGAAGSGGAAGAAEGATKGAQAGAALGPGAAAAGAAAGGAGGALGEGIAKAGSAAESAAGSATGETAGSTPPDVAPRAGTQPDQSSTSGEAGTGAGSALAAEAGQAASEPGQSAPLANGASFGIDAAIGAVSKGGQIAQAMGDMAVEEAEMIEDDLPANYGREGGF